MELIPQKQFREHLKDICLTRIVEAVKGIEALSYIELDRGLFAYEKSNLASFKSQLKINESWMMKIDPEYNKIQ